MTEKNFESFLEAFEDLKSRGKDFVVVTLVNIIGGAPQEMGARMIVTNDGLQFGTVGGGKVEKRAIEEAKSLLPPGKPNRTSPTGTYKKISA